MNIYVNGDFSIISSTVYVDGNLVIEGGEIDLESAELTIGKSFTARDNPEFVSGAFDDARIAVGQSFSFIGRRDFIFDLRATRVWNLFVQGSAFAAFVDVSNSNAGGYTPIIASQGCFNRGNNINWFFGSSISEPSITVIIDCQHNEGYFCKEQGVCVTAKTIIQGGLVPAITNCQNIQRVNKLLNERVG